MTLGAPAVHHSRFTNGGLARMKGSMIEMNKRLCSLQEKLQEILILNSDIDDALDHVTQILDHPLTPMERSVLNLSLQRVVKAVGLNRKSTSDAKSDGLLCSRSSPYSNIPTRTPVSHPTPQETSLSIHSCPERRRRRQSQPTYVNPCALIQQLNLSFAHSSR